MLYTAETMKISLAKETLPFISKKHHRTLKRFTGTRDFYVLSLKHHIVPPKIYVPFNITSNEKDDVLKSY